MDMQFDELSKSLAEGVSRREALRKFGMGLTAVLLAAVGLHSKVLGQNKVKPCSSTPDCGGATQCCNGVCVKVTDNNNCGSCGNVCGAGTTCGKVVVTAHEGGGSYTIMAADK